MYVIDVGSQNCLFWCSWQPGFQADTGCSVKMFLWWLCTYEPIYDQLNFCWSTFADLLNVNYLHKYVKKCVGGVGLMFLFVHLFWVVGGCIRSLWRQRLVSLKRLLLFLFLDSMCTIKIDSSGYVLYFSPIFFM